jgi:hypothetical protein
MIKLADQFSNHYYNEHEVINNIKSGRFLPSWFEKESLNGNEFAKRGSDSISLYEQQLKTQSQDWVYRHKKVKYTLNNLSYRTTDFDKIDWAKSIIMFGCSIVFGEGVDDEDTIAANLSLMLNVPVINMGSPGSSMGMSFHNAVILKNICSKPLGIVNIWTSPDRSSYYHNNYVENFGSWNVKKDSYGYMYAEGDTHASANALFYQMSSKQMWDNTAYYEASYFSSTRDILKCDGLLYSDYGRDNSHQGIEANRLNATHIANKLNL